MSESRHAVLLNDNGLCTKEFACDLMRAVLRDGMTLTEAIVAVDAAEQDDTRARRFTMPAVYEESFLRLLREQRLARRPVGPSRRVRNG